MPENDILSEMSQVVHDLVNEREITHERMRVVARAAGFTVIRQYMPDLLEAQSARSDAEFFSLYDGLTGLANVRGYHSKLKAAVNTAYITGSPISVARYYFDNLKEINDVQGHAAGDREIIVASKLLKWHKPQSPIVDDYYCPSRFESGDEFGVILLGADHETAADWHQKIDANFVAEGLTMRAAVVSCGPEYPMTINELYNHTSSLLLRARQTGVDQFYYPLDHDG